MDPLRLLCLLFIAAVVPAAVPVPRTMCVFAGGPHTAPALTARFATLFYGAALPNATWATRLLSMELPGRPGRVSTRAAVEAFVANGTDCDALVGPGETAVAEALAPLVKVPWLDPLVPTDALSDKLEYPTFSRVIPTVSFNAVLTRSLTYSVGWQDFNVIYSDDDYGRASAETFTSDVTRNNGTVHRRRVLSLSASAAEVAAAVQAIRSSASRVIFFAITRGALLARVFDAVRPLTNEVMPVFADQACATQDTGFRTVPGALCLGFGSGGAAAFQSVFATRSTALDTAALRAAGIAVPSTAALAEFSASNALYHDAAMVFMLAYHTVATATGGSTAALTLPQLRATRILGATGGLALHPLTGDRLGADMVIYSVYGNGTAAVVARVEAGVLIGYPVPFYVLGVALNTTSDDVPSALYPVPDPPGSTSLALPIGITAGAVAVVLLVAVAFIVWRTVTAPTARDNDRAPVHEQTPFAMAFTDIQASTAMWARTPAEMSRAVERHHVLIRELIAEHKGYEVKTIGDAFMVAFKDPSDAVVFALAVQRRFHAERWAPDFDAAYREMTGCELLDADYTGPWHGLRVRIGVSYGEGRIVHDEVTQGYDYYGTVVNTAARVEAAAHGGQVCVTDAVADVVDLDAMGAVLDLGPQSLRGLDHPVRLFQVLPADPGLKERVFPPLRLERQTTVEEFSVAPSRRSSAYRALSLHQSLSVEVEERLSHFAQTLLSTASESERVSMLRTLVRRWHITEVTPDDLADADGRDFALTLVAQRVVRTMDRSESSATETTTTTSRNQTTLTNGSGQGGPLSVGASLLVPPLVPSPTDAAKTSPTPAPITPTRQDGRRSPRVTLTSPGSPAPGSPAPLPGQSEQ